ncbi:ComEC/Rec2 family competence protein [Mesoflavibacter zeaxanthinifaciens]|uniref:ComEC/Rec2 family competence protein n=1 Tax=Flavobacteriaceae TaxID=49546 RepID=UPI003A92C611
MEIKFLKAGSGDCILIHHDKKNILIDGGNDSAFLIDAYNQIILREEKINLLIVTHHDDDHIKGILDLFKYLENKGTSPLIETIIFNSPRKINNTFKVQEANNLLSYKQAYDLENYLWKHDATKRKWLTSLDETIKEQLQEQFGDLKLDIFSPKKEVLSKYASNKGAYLSSDYRCDWNSSMKDLDRCLDDKSQDRTISNSTSIVVHVTYKNQSILLTGDVTPKRFEEIIDEIRGKREQATFNYIKLPHHGSYRSLNSGILKKINCNNFIISTNSKKHYLPNKRALLKIIKNRSSQNAINFFFNYGEVIPKLNIDKKQQAEYKISLEPNKDEWGYGINI